MKIEPESFRVRLPKTGLVKFRYGRLPEGRIVAGNVAWNRRAWELTVQREIPEAPPIILPQPDTV